MAEDPNVGKGRVQMIANSGLSIYDGIPPGKAELWIPLPELEYLLNSRLVGIPLSGLPLRTRSKVVKEHVCQALGYPVPATFRKTRPRFPGQHLDVYVQKSANLQIWNEELEAARRYAIVRVAEDDTIVVVKVVTGADLAELDTTGTLTQKYQARVIRSAAHAELDPGRTQDRNRGSMLHSLVCGCLGYGHYHDDGRFPDVRHQLLEVKLQTSPTIDLGLVDPHSDDPLGLALDDGTVVRHRDVRYAVFIGTTDGTEVTLTHLIVTTGEMFFVRFALFQGNVINRKLQLPLPPGFFGKYR